MIPINVQVRSHGRAHGRPHGRSHGRSHGRPHGRPLRHSVHRAQSLSREGVCQGAPRRQPLWAALAGVVVIGRGVLIRRALSEDKRTQLTVIPAESFDPTGEEVARYAAQLARMRRSFVTRPAQAVRLRLDAVGEGQVAYRVEGPSSARSILQTAGYHDVELHPGDGGDLVAGGAGGGAAGESEPAEEPAGETLAESTEVSDDDRSQADHRDDQVRARDHDGRGEAQPHRRSATGDVEGARR